MDRDTRAVVVFLNDALAESGLTAADFAVAVGTSSSRFSTYRTGRTKPTGQFLMRAKRIGHGLGLARSRRLMSSRDVATEIHHASEADRAWRMLIQGRDHLRLMLDARDGSAASWEPRPGHTGSEEWDALLMALAVHEFHSAAEEAPSWCAQVSRLKNPWISAHPFLTSAEVVASTPSFLAECNIFVAARDLVSV